MQLAFRLKFTSHAGYPGGNSSHVRLVPSDDDASILASASEVFPGVSLKLARSGEDGWLEEIKSGNTDRTSRGLVVTLKITPVLKVGDRLFRLEEIGA